MTRVCRKTASRPWYVVILCSGPVVIIKQCRILPLLPISFALGVLLIIDSFSLILQFIELVNIVLYCIDQACDVTLKSDLGCIVMQEGLANVCLLTDCMTSVRAKIDTTIPRKRRGNCTQHDKVSASV